jgi:hypothetical protein
VVLMQCFGKLTCKYRFRGRFGRMLLEVKYG